MQTVCAAQRGGKGGSPLPSVHLSPLSYLLFLTLVLFCSFFCFFVNLSFSTIFRSLFFSLVPLLFTFSWISFPIPHPYQPPPNSKPLTTTSSLQSLTPSAPQTLKLPFARPSSACKSSFQIHSQRWLTFSLNLSRSAPKPSACSSNSSPASWLVRTSFCVFSRRTASYAPKTAAMARGSLALPLVLSKPKRLPRMYASQIAAPAPAPWWGVVAGVC